MSVKDFSLIYELTKLPVFLATRIFYKKIVFKGHEHIPSKGPVLICSNHVNAFMDPSIIQSAVRRQIYSLARGDVFKGKIMVWLLTRYKIIPIFRLSEGIQNLHKNEEAFNKSFEVLERGNPLIIYPEGICIQEKRLRKLKKGAGRIAFGIGERNKFAMDLTILPVALNYSDAKRFRSTLFVNFGRPFKLSMFRELYEQDKVKATNVFTKYLEEKMAGLMLVVEDRSNDELFEQLLDLCKNDVIKKHNWDKKNLQHDFEASRLIANRLNVLSGSRPDKIEEIKKQCSDYFNALKRYKLRNHLLEKEASHKTGVGDVLICFFLLTVGFPFFMAGLFFNYLPYRVAYRAAKKIAKNIEFYASVNITVGMISWILHYFLLLAITGIASGSWMWVAFMAAAIPATGVFCLHFYFFIKKTRGLMRLLRLSGKSQDQYAKLVSMRMLLRKELNF